MTTVTSDSLCPCGSKQKFGQCCEPFIKGDAQPKTAEALMRARYSAYVTGAMKYLKDTLAPESRKDYDEAGAKQWASKADWRGLQIVSTDKGGEADSKGTVEFIATYRIDGKGIDHHEVSTFQKIQGEWYFVEGDSHQHGEGEGHHHHHHREPIKPVVREEPKIGRNDPCPCGSGKKYKKCHGTAA